MSSKDNAVVSVSPFSPTRSFFDTFTSLSRTGSRHSQRPESPSRFARRSSSSASKHIVSALASNAKSPVIERSSSVQTKKHGRKQSGTILRAVPEDTTCATGPREMPIREASQVRGRMAPATPTSNGVNSAKDHHPLTRRRSNSAQQALSPTAASIKSFSSGTNLRGTIGFYKDGRVQWDNKESYPPRSFNKRPASPHNQKPRIQVVIPIRHTDEKPLPSLPSGNKPYSNHIVSAAGNIDAGYNVSPPTATKSKQVRDSMVSPLSSQPARPTVQFYTPLDVHVSKPTPTLQPSPDLSEGARHSSDDSHDDDRSSTYSDKSSVTSDEADTHDTPQSTANPMMINGRTVSQAFSVKSPVDAGVFEPTLPKAESGRHETGQRPVAPSQRPRVYGSHPVAEEYVEFKPTCALRPQRDTANTSAPPSAIVRNTVSLGPTGNTTSTSSLRETPASQPEMGALNRIVNRPTLLLPPPVASPTLSEAASDLERQLTSFSDDTPFKWDDVAVRQTPPLTPQGLPRKDSVTYFTSRHSPPPLLPRRSDRRQSQKPADQNDSQKPAELDTTQKAIELDATQKFVELDATPKPVELDATQKPADQERSQTPTEHNVFRMSHVPGEHIASQWRRSKARNGRNLSVSIPEPKRLTTDDFSLSPLPLPPQSAAQAITPDVAENLITKILESLESLDDLFAFAVVNRGFYRVFKRSELKLMQAALYKESPPAWEHREICYPGHDDLDEEELDRPRQEYTATSYIRYYTRDMYIISAIKSLIKDKCESFLRPEISDALVSDDPVESARVDNALWRIWTFCKIFGSGKAREDDIIAQMDWLKGGVIVHEQNFSASALTWDDMNETLASAPECFAKGNEGGLSAEQLFDMMELWNCLGVLLQPIEGRTIQAREHGVFDNTDIRGGDIDGEELMLDEWYYYLLTLGLSTILDLTGPCRQTDASVFHIADQHGCLDWKPPVFGGTRRNFLKEAASRVYEDKIALTYAETSTKEVQRALSKQRIQKHISELRHRQQSGENLPYVRMSQERPMSDWEGVFKNLTRPRPPPATNNLVTHIPSLHSSGFTSALAKELSAAVSAMENSRPPTQGSQSPPRRTVAMPLLPSPPPSTVVGTVRNRSSIATSIATTPQSPPRRTVAMPLLPSPPPSTIPGNRSSIATSIATSAQSPPRRIVAMPLLPSPPPSTVASNRDRSSMASSMPAIEEHPAFARDVPEMPRLEEHPMYGQHARQASADSLASETASNTPAFHQHPLQRMAQEHDSSENTADRAIYRIVEMGFTPEQARLALRMTDLGDGLRVDRAVELLLREGVL